MSSVSKPHTSALGVCHTLLHLTIYCLIDLPCSLPSPPTLYSLSQHRNPFPQAYLGTKILVQNLVARLEVKNTGGQNSLSQYPHSALQTSVTPVPGDLMPSSGLHCHYAYTLYIGIHASRTPMHKKKKLLNVKKSAAPPHVLPGALDAGRTALEGR